MNNLSENKKISQIINQEPNTLFPYFLLGRAQYQHECFALQVLFVMNPSIQPAASKIHEMIVSHPLALDHLAPALMNFYTGTYSSVTKYLSIISSIFFYVLHNISTDFYRSIDLLVVHRRLLAAFSVGWERELAGSWSVSRNPIYFSS